MGGKLRIGCASSSLHPRSEPLRQGAAGPNEEALDGRDRGIERLGDFLIREFFVAPADDGHPLGGGKLSDGRPDRSRPLGGKEPFFGQRVPDGQAGCEIPGRSSAGRSSAVTSVAVLDTMGPRFSVRL